MGREHEPETVWWAQELYCVKRLSFDAVALETGVAASTLKRWAETYGWRAKREELARAEADIRADKLLARSVMLKALIDTKDPQTGFAVASLESLALKEATIARKEAADEALRRLEAERTQSVTQVENIDPLPQTDEERMAIIQTALDKELVALIHASPGEVLARVEKLQRSLAQLRQLVGQDGQSGAEQGGEHVAGWES